jgi:penicillin amidase
VAMQLDYYSDAARQLVEALADVEPREGKPLTVRALEHLRRWDYCLTADSVAAAIYVVLRQNFLCAVFGPRLGKLAGTYLGNAPVEGVAGSAYPGRLSGFLLDILRRADPAWLGATGPSGTWDDLKWDCLGETVRELRALLGDDMDTWRWGRLHQLTFDHPLGRVKPLDRLFCRGPYPVGGDADTPHQTSFSGGGYGATGWIPSYRQIVDLGNLANSRSIHTTGQSGLPGSPHFDDFIPLWRNGRYHPMRYDRKEILEDLEHLLVLRPR